jgi:large subunit ribosomal protein L35
MPRIKRGVTTRAKHKRILDNAKGYYGRRKNTIRIARQAVEKAGQYAYRDRKVKKRFKLTATGKIKHGVAGKRHRLISHNAKYIRQNRGTSVLSDADTRTVKLWAPYGLD